MVDKDETAVIIVQFCADPRPRKIFWEWDTFRLDTDTSTARHTADEIRHVRSIIQINKIIAQEEISEICSLYV